MSHDVIRDALREYLGITEIMTRLESHMATVRQNLEAIGTAVAGIEEDVPRVLQELQTLLEQLQSGDVELSPELQAQVDQKVAALQALNSAMDAAVPPAPSEPTPGEPTEPPPGPTG